MGFIDKVFNLIMSLFLAGPGNLFTVVFQIIRILLYIQIIYKLYELFSGELKFDKALVRDLAQYILFATFVTLYPDFMKFISEIASRIGLMAGGSNIDLYKLDVPDIPFFRDIVSKYNNTDIPLPSTIMAHGIYNCMPILDAAQNSGFDVPASLFYYISWFFMMFCYIYLTGIFITIYFKYGITFGVGIIFIPFGIAKPTQFITEKFFGAVIGHAIEILILNFVLAVSVGVLASIRAILADNLSAENIAIAISVPFIFVIIFKNISNVAQALGSGSPSMTSMPNLGGMVMGAAAAGAAAFGAANLAKKGLIGSGKAGIQLAAGTGKAISAGSSAMKTFQDTMGLSGQSPSRLSFLGSGVQAFAKSAMSSVGGSFRTLGTNMAGKIMHGKNFTNQNPNAFSNSQGLRQHLTNRFVQGKQLGSKHGIESADRVLKPLSQENPNPSSTQPYSLNDKGYVMTPGLNGQGQLNSYTDNIKDKMGKVKSDNILSKMEKLNDE